MSASEARGFSRKTAADCRAFWEQYLFPYWPKGRIHPVLDNTSYTTPAETDGGLLSATAYLNEHPTSYRWGKI